MRNIAILGSTGSIGVNALKVAAHLKNQVRVVALAAKSNIDLIERQAKECTPDLIAIYEESQALELQRRLPQIPVVAGIDGLKAVASLLSADLVISAMSGAIGLIPTMAAIEAGKDVALANKEVLVSGGSVVMRAVKEKGVRLLPVDSEHSAIFQCLNGEDINTVNRLILTSSGGPFRKFSLAELEAISLEQALCHPTWNMGAKITIDSSTLMNKGLEVIEAHWLFDIPVEQIDVVVHPQSIIHSMVEFADGSIIAQMGEPTMIVPIQYAMTFPERVKGLLKPFNFFKNSSLEFYSPDMEKFRCLRLAYQALKQGGSLPCFMNAANEILVGKFLERKISWNEIARKLEDLMMNHKTRPLSKIEDVLAVDRLAREEANQA